MFAMNKDTMMMVSITVALLAIFLLYRDMQKTKLELQNLTDERTVPSKVVVAPKKVVVSPPPPPAATVVADETE